MAFSVILTEKGGPTQRLDFDAEEITVGRVDENDICLPKGNISKKHTKIVVKNGKIIVLDLKSTNGTYVNGKKLAAPQVIQPSDNVYIGDFILNVEPPDVIEVEGAGAAADEATAEDADALADGDAPMYEDDEPTHRAARPKPPADEDAVATSAPGKLRVSRVAVTTPSPRSTPAAPARAAAPAPDR